MDVILDMVGGDYFPRHLALLATDGRLIHIAHGSGNKVELDLSTLMRKRLVVTGSTLRSRPVSEKRVLRDSIEQQVWPSFLSGRLRPVIDCHLSFGRGCGGASADGTRRTCRQDLAADGVGSQLIPPDDRPKGLTSGFAPGEIREAFPATGAGGNANLLLLSFPHAIESYSRAH